MEMSCYFVRTWKEIHLVYAPNPNVADPRRLNLNANECDVRYIFRSISCKNRPYFGTRYISARCIPLKKFVSGTWMPLSTVFVASHNAYIVMLSPERLLDQGDKEHDRGA